MKKTITFMTAMVLSAFAFAQDLDFKWGGLFQTTGSNQPFIYDIDRDSSGNYYVVGTIGNGDTVDMDIKAGVTQLSPDGSLAAFVAKYSNVGDLLWAKLIQGNSGVIAKSVIVRPSQDVLIGGDFAGTADFDPGVADQLVTSNGGDWFILRLNPAGQYVTVAAQPAAGTQTFGKLKQDKDGALYYNFRDFSISGAKAEVVIKSGVSSSWQYFITANPGSSQVSGNDFTIDTAGNVYLTGSYNGTLYYNPANSSQVINSNFSNSQPYLLKINSTGSYGYIKSFRCDYLSSGTCVTTDEASNVYFSGFFRCTFPVDFGASLSLNSPDVINAFIIKYNAAGVAQWAKQLVGTGANTTERIMLDKSGNIYASGYYKDTVDFNPDSTAVNNLIRPNINTPFILKLTKGGQFSGVADLKAKASGFFNSVKVINDEVLSVGRFSTDTVDLNLGTAESIYAADKPGQSCAFFAKHTFAACPATASANSTGLTVNITDAASYEWVNCATNLPLASGASQSVVLTQSTNAFVRIEKGFCSAQSACAQFTPGSVGIKEATGGFDFNLYPNPANTMVTLEIKEKASSVKIIDMLGKVAFELANPSEQETINVSNFAKGVYLVSVEIAGQRSVKRLTVGN